MRLDGEVAIGRLHPVGWCGRHHHVSKLPPPLVSTDVLDQAVGNHQIVVAGAGFKRGEVTRICDDVVKPCLLRIVLVVEIQRRNIGWANRHSNPYTGQVVSGGQVPSQSWLWCQRLISGPWPFALISA